jgi:CRP-like cAMP-binding protein
MEIEKIIRTLTTNSRFFHAFSEEEMMDFLKRCSSKSHRDGEVIFREDSSGTELFIIVSGSVRVKKDGRIIDVVRSGECFGEMGALSGENRSATMEANGDVVLLAIDEKKIATLPVEAQAKLFKNTLMVVSERLRKRLEERSHGS